MTEALATLADLPIAQLAVRMASVAVFTVLVALIAERVGPFFGAMVASLPVYTGPVYLFLAMDYPPEFLARVAVASIAAFGLTPVYLLAYGLFARAGHTMLLSLSGALGAWLVFAVFVQLHDWPLTAAFLFAIAIFAAGTAIAPRFTNAIPRHAGARTWSDLLLRVLLVTLVVGVVNGLSPFVPTKLTGILSIMPVVTSSLIIVLHGRIGGPATAALLAHSISGLVGMLLAITLVAATVASWGPALSLSLALGVSVAWNLMLIAVRQGRARFGRRPR